MPVEARFITDPACPWSWATEPVVRRLMTEFGEDLSWRFVMGGLARVYDEGYADLEAGIGGPAGPWPGLVSEWLDAGGDSGMPLDPRLWTEAPIGSTYPACMAVTAAAEQGPDAAYAMLRALREGLFCFRRKLDTTEALVEEARRAGLRVDRFRSDLASHAIVEAFGADLEETRTVPDEARAAGAVKQVAGKERVPFPSAAFVAEDGVRHWVFGPRPLEEWRAAAEAAGARASGKPVPDVADGLGRFGRMATREVEVVCDLPETRAAAELWRLASEWRARPVRVLTGHLWEPA